MSSVESYISVVTEELISRGTLLGPLPLSSGSPDSLSVLTWRCVDKLTTSKQVIKVTPKDQFSNRSNKTPSWLSHILPARKPEEQTLEIVVKGGQLYFRAMRDISEGEELRAWFGQDLADVLKLPVIPPNGVEGEKRFECMLCQEQFENPFPVVAHLMYRCRRKDQGVNTLQNPFRKRNSSRVKNFNIATLTDMTDESPRTPPSSQTSLPEEHDTETVLEIKKTHQKEVDDYAIPPQKRSKVSEDNNDQAVKRCQSSEDSDTKRSRLQLECESKSIESSPPRKPPNGAFKLTSSSSPTYHPPIYSRVDLNHHAENNSAFKKVDKSSATFHPSMSLFSGSLDPREILFQTGPNSFTPFPYPMTPVTSSYGTIPQQTHPGLSIPSMDGHLTSAFAPSTKLPTTAGGDIHQQLKMAEEFKMLRKAPYEMEARMTPLQYVNPKSPPSMETFPTKGMPAPLLPFLPPSLAALSFPSQNWCAKCNASFRMTSDLVYHMRSHHKRETDPQKLKREEKLRCHICNETFRERHHLTRHMTSHQ